MGKALAALGPAFAFGFLVGAAMMASPALAVAGMIIAAIYIGAAIGRKTK